MSELNLPAATCQGCGAVVSGPGGMCPQCEREANLEYWCGPKDEKSELGFKPPIPDWRPGRGYGAIVTQDAELLAELAAHDADSGGYSDRMKSTAEAYGGAVVCETMHPRYRALVCLTPEAYALISDLHGLLVDDAEPCQLKLIQDRAAAYLRKARGQEPLDPPKALPSPREATHV